MFYDCFIVLSSLEVRDIKNTAGQAYSIFLVMIFVERWLINKLIIKWIRRLKEKEIRSATKANMHVVSSKIASKNRRSTASLIMSFQTCKSIRAMQQLCRNKNGREYFFTRIESTLNRVILKYWALVRIKLKSLLDSINLGNGN